MSATDELRRLLDERGVEYKRHYLNTLWHAGTKLYMATDDTDGTLTVDNLTPEQAVAATLGSEPPYDELLRCLENDWHISASWDGLRKFWLIRLTEEGVRLRDAELNNRAERTCRNTAEPDEMYDSPFTCSECGARGPYGEGTYHIGGSREVDGHLVLWDSWPVYKYCPNCGAKVVSE